MNKHNHTGLDESVSVASNTMQAVNTGKAISAAAKGAAAGGPYGAVIGAALSARKHIGKIAAAALVLLALPLLFILLLPGLAFGSLTDSGASGAAGQPILNNNAAITENMNQAAFAINQILGEGIENVQERIANDFAGTGGDHYEVVNPYEGDLISNANLFISQYCAAKELDFASISLTDMEQILRAGAEYGLVPKIHANELAVSGGVQVGVRNKALSVDHLERMGAEEIEVLRTSGTMPTMLPGAAFFLEMPYPPARAMIEGGLSVALASDFNPGSSPSGSMKMIVSLACIKMRMTPAEAINAATLNGAYAMGLSRDYGSVTLGKVANFFLTTKIPSVAYLPYAYTSPLIHRVFLRGQEVK